MTAAEDEMVTHVPPGYRHLMLIVAFTKYGLQSLKMSAHQRLDFLEKMNGLVDLHFTQEMLAAIQPMCRTQVEMLRQARSLDPPGDKLGKASFEVLTSEKVFRHFLGLNPSILDAIKIPRKEVRQ